MPIVRRRCAVHSVSWRSIVAVSLFSAAIPTPATANVGAQESEDRLIDDAPGRTILGESASERAAPPAVSAPTESGAETDEWWDPQLETSHPLSVAAKTGLAAAAAGAFSTSVLGAAVVGWGLSVMVALPPGNKSPWLYAAAFAGMYLIPLVLVPLTAIGPAVTAAVVGGTVDGGGVITAAVATVATGAMVVVALPAVVLVTGVLTIETLMTPALAALVPQGGPAAIALLGLGTGAFIASVAAGTGLAVGSAATLAGGLGSMGDHALDWAIGDGEE